MFYAGQTGNRVSRGVFTASFLLQGTWANRIQFADTGQKRGQADFPDPACRGRHITVAGLLGETLRDDVLATGLRAGLVSDLALSGFRLPLT